jgi:hypothetical protein
MSSLAALGMCQMIKEIRKRPGNRPVGELASANRGPGSTDYRMCERSSQPIAE